MHDIEAFLALLAQPIAKQPALAGWYTAVVSTMLGMLVGSFLNVVIARMPHGQSVVTPRSRCPKCENGIAWYDNIPVFSWAVLLRGKCRHCGAPIAWRYPAIELLIGAFFLGGAARYGFSVAWLEFVVFSTVLIAIAFIDMDHWIILPKMALGLIPVGLAFAWWQEGTALAFSAESALFVPRVIGAVAGGGAFSALLVAANGIARRAGRIGPDESAMGWGDPMLVAGIGAFLGWQALPLMIFLSSLQGAIIGAIMLRTQSLSEPMQFEGEEEWEPPETGVPYGPFLVLAALEVALFGPAIQRLLGGFF